jgi:hypothetical protein
MSIRLGIGIDNFASGGIDADATTIYNRIIADGGVSNLTRLNFFVKGLKAIYGDLANVPVCYDAHWIGYKLGSGTGATAGQAAAKLYSLTVAGDAVQATAASQPLLLAHNGASSDNYWWGSGIAGNYCSTPNAAANQITGDIEIIAKIEGTPLTGQRIVRKRSIIVNYDFYISDVTNTQLSIFFGASIGLATSSVGFTMISTGLFVKVTRTASNGNVNFFTSSDGVTYTQLGTTQTTIAGNLTTSTDIVEIGSATVGIAANFRGKIYRATISNSIGGTPVVDFNPATYNASTSQTAWTSSTGEVWTINTGTATTGYKGVLVNRTIVMADGVDDTLISSTLASRQYFTSYNAIKTYSSAAPDQTITSGGILAHVIYFNLSLHKIFNGINLVAFATSNDAKLITVDFNSTNSKINKNNETNTVGNTGILTSVLCQLFSYGPATFGNIIMTTIAQSNTVNSDATKTAMYNLIRSLNNNAF